MTVDIVEQYCELFRCLSCSLSDSKLAMEPNEGTKKGESIHEEQNLSFPSDFILIFQPSKYKEDYTEHL